MRKIFTTLFVFSVVAIAQYAQAANVSFDLFADPAAGTFDLFASASLGDNAGIASYGVVLTGGVLTVDHNSPVDGFANGAGGSGAYGLSLLRSNDDDFNLGASQDTVSQPGRTIFGFGQTASDFASEGITDATGGTAVEGDPWGAPLLIASGTWDGQTIGINEGSVNTLANVLQSTAGAATEAAIIATSVTIGGIIPEPGTLALASLGLIGLVAGRRRS